MDAADSRNLYSVLASAGPRRVWCAAAQIACFTGV